MMGDYVKGDHLFVCQKFGQVQWLNLGKDSTDKRKMHGWKFKHLQTHVEEKSAA